VLTQSALPQSLGTGSISGHVLSEEGRTVRASVTLSFAAARGYPSPPRRMFTGPNGAFTTDSCPKCCDDLNHAHLDNYTTDRSCSGVGSLPNALTIRLY